MKPKGLIFDMDGTMFDTETISVRAMQYAAALHHITLSMDTIYSFMGLPGAVIQKKMAEQYGSAFDYHAYLQDKIAFQDREIEEHGVPVKPGLREVLTYALQNGIPCAVATSTNRMRATSLIAQSGLTGFFSAVVCGDEVEHGKPNPDIFLLAAEKIGAAPKDCIGIEDSRNGILALHRSPLLGVLIPDLILPDEEMKNAADLQFDSLLSFLDFLKREK